VHLRIIERDSIDHQVFLRCVLFKKKTIKTKHFFAIIIMLAASVTPLVFTYIVAYQLIIRGIVHTFDAD
jgi:hypothetical protein